MIEFRERINSSEYWFLRNLSFVDGTLILIISEGKLSGQIKNLTPLTGGGDLRWAA
jgi:hypothetical protein